MNLNQVTLAVHDMSVATEFYVALGFIKIVENELYARFQCPEGDSTFSIYLERGKITNTSIIYFEHEKLDDLVGKLKSKGIIFAQEPTDQPYLWREAILNDPSGNQIKLYWAGENRLNPPWKI